jgi:hypothetical protein
VVRVWLTRWAALAGDPVRRASLAGSVQDDAA